MLNDAVNGNLKDKYVILGLLFCGEFVVNDLYNKKLKSLSRALRTNMTNEEKRLLYDFLKDLPITFKRQKVIGNYVVDFYCAKAKLVIELDGRQHYSELGRLVDKERDLFLNNQGMIVLRYSNGDIKNDFDKVCKDITLYIERIIGVSLNLL